MQGETMEAVLPEKVHSDWQELLILAAERLLCRAVRLEPLDGPSLGNHLMSLPTLQFVPQMLKGLFRPSPDMKFSADVGVSAESQQQQQQQQQQQPSPETLLEEDKVGFALFAALVVTS